jgi:hypothetical protein
VAAAVAVTPPNPMSQRLIRRKQTSAAARAPAAAQDQLERVWEAAEGLRQAGEEHAAGGLLARLRAALRGVEMEPDLVPLALPRIRRSSGLSDLARPHRDHAQCRARNPSGSSGHRYWNMLSGD